MLAVEIDSDNGVRITGTVRDLCNLIGWVAIAVADGHSHPAYVTDKGLTSIVIDRVSGDIL